MLTISGGESLSTAMANKREMVSKSIRRKGRTVDDCHFLAYSRGEACAFACEWAAFSFRRR